MANSSRTVYLIDGERIALGEIRFAYFMLMYNARGRGVRAEEFRSKVYGITIDGSPEQTTIPTTICLLRRRLARTRFRIVVTKKFDGWRLVRVPPGSPAWEPRSYAGLRKQQLRGFRAS